MLSRGRFVLLRHETPGSEAISLGNHRDSYTGQRQRITSGRHWDLMLEDGLSLLTLAFEELPAPVMPGQTRSPNSWPAKRLADHRPLYLDYEGPVSQNRGNVFRVAAGNFTSSKAAFSKTDHNYRDHHRLVQLESEGQIVAQFKLPDSTPGFPIVIQLDFWLLCDAHCK